jgi:hypothetical protein
MTGALVVGTAGPATAATPPEHFALPLEFSESFDDCGFVVDFTTSGTLRVTLWRNEAGLVVRERDSGLFNETYTNAETGKTFSTVDSLSSWWDYGSGAVLGSSVKITVVGMGGSVPGSGPDAGRTVATGTVVDFLPEGIPIVEGTDEEPLSIAGRHPDQDVCAALS